MGDFLLDFKRGDERAIVKASEFLRFYEDMRVERYGYPEFTLLLSCADNPQIWSPFSPADQSLLIALCGRIALDQQQWDEASKVEGQGGLACKFISRIYAESGIAGVENLSGNFTIILFDRSAQKLFLVTDRWGLLPSFKFSGAGHLVFGSHPDAVADLVGESHNWDLTSLAEFVLTGKVSAPYTYYSKIKALPVGSTTTVSFDEHAVAGEQSRTYFQFQPRPEPLEKTEELAEQFAAAFRQSIAKRTLPILGKSAVALSGGLDSRTVLCAASDPRALLTFSCYDQENLEFRIARSIANAAGAEFVPLKRPFDHYGNNAALGVRISAGMGCIASNHFLGFRPHLRQLGIQNLLTGCYCDYLFKGLAINKRVNSWTTQERVNGFDFSYYFNHYNASSELGGKVRQRLEGLFPPELRQYNNESVIQTVEQRRMFPLAYEEDNTERTIPQRVMGWYIPIAENSLMDILQKMSCGMKLNRSLFARAVVKICGDTISKIPDANTGVPVGASVLREASSAHLRRAGRLLKKLKPSSGTEGSWLNWNYYARQSKVVQTLWASPSNNAVEVFRQVLGHDGFSTNMDAYVGPRSHLFLQLFTLKLWFDQRP